MTPEQWAELRHLFEALCDLPEDERQAQLAALEASPEIRQQVVELLAFDNATAIDGLAGEIQALSERLSAEDLRGERVGAWRLLRPLGEGGMGEVYLAERADGRYEVRVAIKFLAIGGKRARHLFDRERRILARLNHPAIARLLDAGEHARLGAWLAMDYMDGEPIDHCAGRAACSATGVITWMAEAARAVAVAHQNLVLHRDLKPDHLLITADGQLRILDFGVAALMRGRSGEAEHTGHASFTPRYAAPEQILDLASTTRTDVYALGLILFELLAGGNSPFGNDPDRLTARKLADQPDRLRPVAGLGRRQRRDLEAILARCMALDPARRYAGASELAADLEALLDDRPIRARAPRWPELLQRWLARHRLAGAMLAIALLAIVGGSGFSAWFAWQASIERNHAVAEAAKAREITHFLESIFASSAPGIEQGPETTVRELLDRGRERIGEELAMQPVVAAHLERTIARSYLYLGLHDEALAILESPRPGESESSLQKREVLAARVDNLKGEYRDALQRLDGIKPSLLDWTDGAEAGIQRATAEINLGRLEAAGVAAQRVIALADDSVTGLDYRLNAQNLLGAIAFNQGDYDAARAVFAEIHRLHVQRNGPAHNAAGLALNNLGGVALMQGDLVAALDYYQRSAAVFEAYYGVDNRAMAMVQRSLGLTYRRMGHAADAETALRRAVAAYEAWGGRDSHAWREALLQLTELMVILDRDAEAVGLLVTLPPMQDEIPEHERPVVCRLEQLLAATGASDAGGADCQLPPGLPDSVRAMAHFLIARSLRDQRDAAFEQEVAAARGLIATLNPPDPLLAAAVESL